MMPSKTAKQARFMAACAHGWTPKGGKCPSKKVSKEFNKADKGSGVRSTKAKINKQNTRHGKLDLPFHSVKRFAGKAEGGDVSKMEQKHANWMKAHGAPAKMVKEERSEKMAKGGGVESKGKTKGKCVKMAKGGGVEIRGKTRGKFI